MTEAGFDVVTVPDFTGAAAGRFEILTLFFLASWMEYGGRSRDLPLHVACIGEAPDSVRRMAARCGACVTSHSPEPAGGFANKLRGFEVARKTEHLLLLDTDIFVLGEIHGLARELGPECVAAAPANGPFPVSNEHWPGIYESLGLPLPDREVLPVNLALDTFQSVNFRDRKDFPPLYNGGVVYAPWRAELGEVWREHLGHIAANSARFMGPKAARSNQPSLATAIARLEQQGFRFQFLPDEYNARWQHLTTGAIPSAKARIFHALGFGRERRAKPKTSVERFLAKMTPGYERRRYAPSAERAARNFGVVLRMQMEQVRSHREPESEAARRPRVEDCERLHARVEKLYDKHVKALLP